MKLITKLCNYKTIILLTIIFMFVFIKNKMVSFLILINNILNIGINTIIKFFIKRPRPAYKLIKQGGYSFPSGHAMISIAMYGFLIFLINKYIKNKLVKSILIFINILIILLVGISRIYLGVHYTSDVLSGYLISLIYLINFIRYTNKKIP